MAGRRYSLRTKVLFTFMLAFLPVALLMVLGVQFFLVPYVENQTIDELSNSTKVLANAIKAGGNVAIKNHLRGIAERNLDIAKHFFSLVDQGVLTKKQAVDMLRGILLSQNIGQSGYIYCLNSEGKLDVHPKEELVGRSVAEFEFVQQQMRQKTGYLEYDWKNPRETKPRPKALYMVYFKPLDWIISVSSYRSEFTQLLNPDDFRQTILSIKFGKSGYAFLMDYAGFLLIHPKLGKYNIKLSRQLPKGFVGKMIEKGTGYLEYDWKNPGQSKKHKKMAVFSTIPEFKWIVASSAYTEEVMQPVFYTKLIAYGFILLILMMASLTAYVLSGFLVKPIVSMIRQLDYNSRNNVNEFLPVVGSRETARLATDFNSFIKAINQRNEELARERQRYQSLFESCPDAVLLLNNMTIIDCSPSTMTVFHCTKDQVVGKTVVELSPPTQFSGMCSLDDVIRILDGVPSDSLSTFEWRHMDFQGNVFEAEVRLSQFAHDGEDRLFVAYLRDITEKRKADQAIRTERDFSKALVEASPAYILNIDNKGTIHLANPSFCNAMEAKAGELVGKSVFEFIKGELERSRIYFILKEMVDRKDLNDPVRKGSCTLLTLSGGELLVQWSATNVEPTGYTPASVIVVGIDLSEERSLQDQLFHAQKLEALGRLAGGVAHDFNNMLGGIIGATELIEHKISPDDPVRKYVELIGDTVDKAAKLSGRLLAFSRKGKKVSTPVNAHAILDDAFRVFRSGLDPKFVIELNEKATSFNTVGDPSQLQNVFLNLFINARDAMSEGGKISVYTRNVELDEDTCQNSAFDLDPGNYIEITVSDVGCGIPEDILNKIFEPFFTTKNEGKGTGLGLASVYGAVRDHHGEVLVQSKLGEGTTFIIHLPSVDVEVSSVTVKAEPVRGKGCILLVDDDEMLRTTGSLLLEELGYAVITAVNGLDGLEKYKAYVQEIDLIILDMVMPQMNGHDAFYALRKLNPDAKIIVASGFSDKNSVVELERDGLIGFVHKPYRLAELSVAVSDALG